MNQKKYPNVNKRITIFLLFLIKLNYQFISVLPIIDIVLL